MDKRDGLSFLPADYTQNRTPYTQGSPFGDSLEIDGKVYSALINSPYSQPALIKQMTRSSHRVIYWLSIKPVESCVWSGSYAHRGIPGLMSYMKQTATPSNAHTCWDSFSQMWEFSQGRGKHIPHVTLGGYLVLRNTESLSSESTGCPLLCCFLVE